MAKSLKELILEGYCDGRGAVTGATVNSLPGWESKSGVVFMCIKDNFLGFYEIDFKGNVGKRVAVVEIAKLENFVFKAKFLVQFLSFEYEGKYYEFTNFGNHKALKRVFAEERGK